ncbi:MAG TPA: transketolase C-terminal domain-containing protein [Draconibacterium sp.]|nr:transketolase C-terminal domain-containing protein [Draconibacterium sp.]
MNSITKKRTEMRDAFAEILVELGLKYEKMLFLDADLHTSTKASEFKKRFPDRFIQNGIAEQNMFGVAAGLAFEGFIPVPSTFAVFASRRALDQIAISICYPNLNVKIPGSYVGIPTSRAGASHNSIEDIAIMRSMPNMKVADPCSSNDLKAIMRKAMETNGPVYWRISRYELPEIFEDEHSFEWGKGVVISEGSDVTLFGTGIMTDFNIRAAKLLAEENIMAEVIHLASIKPIDREMIIQSVLKTGCAVTAENASINGGFGDAVLEVLAEEHAVPAYKIGVRDKFIESGGIEELFSIHKMQPTDIGNAAKQVIKKKFENI